MVKKSTQEMDETVSEDFLRPRPFRQSTIWTCGQEDSKWTLSTDTNNYAICLLYVHTLYIKLPYKECVSREVGEISYTEVGNSAQIDKKEGSEEKIVPICDKSNLSSLEQQVSEIHCSGHQLKQHTICQK